MHSRVKILNSAVHADQRTVLRVIAGYQATFKQHKSAIQDKQLLLVSCVNMAGGAGLSKACACIHHPTSFYYLDHQTPVTGRSSMRSRLQLSAAAQ
jgi:hypothetical protein